MLLDQTEKDTVAITTDDLCPRNLKMWDIFDNLKKEFPHLKITAFTIPKFKDLNSENLDSPNSEFYDWYEKRIDWVEIALHGFSHSYPPEFLRWKEYQLDIISKSINALKLFLPEKHIGLRPPGSQFNEFTKQACVESDLSYLAPLDHLIPLKPTKNIKCSLINSHLSKNQHDSLDKISKNLESLLQSSNCIFLSELFI